MLAAKFLEDVWITIPTIAECLKDSDSHVHSVVIEHHPRLGVQGTCSITFQWMCSIMFVVEFWEDIRIAIPVLAKRLRAHDLQPARTCWRTLTASFRLALGPHFRSRCHGPHSAISAHCFSWVEVRVDKADEEVGLGF